MGIRSWWAKRGRPATAEQPEEERYGLNQYIAESMAFGGHRYPLYGASATYGRSESLEHDFSAYVRQAFKGDGVVYACIVARQMIFTEMRFAWQKLEQGRPADISVDNRLKILEKPWPGAGTGDLLARALQDADLAGNFYCVREGNRLRRLRPDWVEIVLTGDPNEDANVDVHSYIYWPGGVQARRSPVYYTADQMVHWAPIPDPEAPYRGMSWLSPVIMEILGDKGATLHKKKFFDNAATPNISVALKETVTKEQFTEFMEAMERAHGNGVQDAYKTLYLGGGADVRVIGANLQQLDFKVTQGAGETRIAAAARVHPVIVGLSEGMQGSSLNAGNFKAAKDAFADGTLRPMWRSACQAFSVILDIPRNSRLWYDDRDIPFLRADQTERAQVLQRESAVIRTLVDGGFKPESVIEAVRSQDWTLLEHTGLVSVQLLPPGTVGGPPGGGGSGAPGDNQNTQPGKRPGTGGSSPGSGQSGGTGTGVSVSPSGGGSDV